MNSIRTFSTIPLSVVCCCSAVLFCVHTTDTHTHTLANESNVNVYIMLDAAPKIYAAHAHILANGGMVAGRGCGVDVATPFQ